MPRYIDADWLAQRIEGWQDQLAIAYGKNDDFVLCLQEVLAKIDDAPTVNVVEVVRCRDCKFSIPLRDIESSVITYDCEIFGRWDLAEDFYCADGERREDVRND